MSLPVTFSVEATEQLANIEDYIAAASYEGTAIRYIQRLKKRCLRIGHAPFQGTAREDFRPGARTTGFEGRVTIIFEVQPDQVVIIGIYYGGKSFR